MYLAPSCVNEWGLNLGTPSSRLIGREKTGGLGISPDYFKPEKKS